MVFIKMYSVVFHIQNLEVHMYYQLFYNAYSYLTLLDIDIDITLFT